MIQSNFALLLRQPPETSPEAALMFADLSSTLAFARLKPTILFGRVEFSFSIEESFSHLFIPSFAVLNSDP